VSSVQVIPFALLASVYENPSTEPVLRPKRPCKLGPILFPSPSPRVWHWAQRVLKRLAPFFASPIFQDGTLASVRPYCLLYSGGIMAKAQAGDMARIWIWEAGVFRVDLGGLDAPSKISIMLTCGYPQSDRSAVACGWTTVPRESTTKMELSAIAESVLMSFAMPFIRIPSFEISASHPPAQWQEALQ
jgi:hypothetical protein